MTNETIAPAAPKRVIVPAYKGKDLVCSNCDALYSSMWFRSKSFENVLVCRVCVYVHIEKVGIEGDLEKLYVENSRPILSQFDWHRKPKGWTGAPCPICGCTAKRLKALHRALRAEESHRRGGLWVKTFKVAFGTDSAIETIKTED